MNSMNEAKGTELLCDELMLCGKLSAAAEIRLSAA